VVVLILNLLGKKASPAAGHDDQDKQDDLNPNKEQDMKSMHRIRGYLLQVLFGIVLVFPWIIVNLGYQYSYMKNVSPIYDHISLASEIAQQIHNLYGYSWQSLLDRHAVYISSTILLNCPDSDKVTSGRQDLERSIQMLGDSHTRDLPNLVFGDYLSWYDKIVNDFVCTPPSQFSLAEPNDDTSCRTVPDVSEEHVLVFDTKLIGNDTKSLGNFRMTLYRIIDLLATAVNLISSMNSTMTDAQNMTVVMTASKSKLRSNTSSARGSSIY
jgi:hypothetical protein